MKQLTPIILLALLAGCVSAPKEVTFNNQTVGTYSTAAGCHTLQLKQDCSQLSGSTRNIEINGIKLRASGSEDGKIIFIMSKPKFIPDQLALKTGASEIEAFLTNNGISILGTKVMYGSDRVFGVQYSLDGDGYSLIKGLTVDE